MGDFSDFKRLIEFITLRSYLKKITKDVCQQEENLRQKEGPMHKKPG